MQQKEWGIVYFEETNFNTVRYNSMKRYEVDNSKTNYIVLALILCLLNLNNIIWFWITQFDIE